MQGFIFFFFCERMFRKYTLHVNVWHALHGIRANRNVMRMPTYARACILKHKITGKLSTRQAACTTRSPFLPTLA